MKPHFIVQPENRSSERWEVLPFHCLTNKANPTVSFLSPNAETFFSLALDFGSGYLGLGDKLMIHGHGKVPFMIRITPLSPTHLLTAIGLHVFGGPIPAVGMVTRPMLRRRLEPFLERKSRSPEMRTAG